MCDLNDSSPSALTLFNFASQSVVSLSSLRLAGYAKRRTWFECVHVAKASVLEYKRFASSDPEGEVIWVTLI